MVNSYKAEVIADSSGEWAGNSCRFATADEAAAYAIDLMGRWTLVREWRVEPSEDPVNYRVSNDGELERIETEDELARKAERDLRSCSKGPQGPEDRRREAGR